MKTDDTTRQVQLLATVLALVSSYYAIRASLCLPKYREMLVELDAITLPRSLGTLILMHPYWYLALVIATLVATLVAIWREFPGHKLFYPLGIVLQFVLLDRAVASGFAPLVRIISNIGQ
jgi:hypothetical protein